MKLTSFTDKIYKKKIVIPYSEKYEIKYNIQERTKVNDA